MTIQEILNARAEINKTIKEKLYGEINNLVGLEYDHLKSGNWLEGSDGWINFDDHPNGKLIAWVPHKKPHLVDVLVSGNTSLHLLEKIERGDLYAMCPATDKRPKPTASQPPLTPSLYTDALPTMTAINVTNQEKRTIYVYLVHEHKFSGGNILITGTYHIAEGLDEPQMSGTLFSIEICKPEQAKEYDKVATKAAVEKVKDLLNGAWTDNHVIVLSTDCEKNTGIHCVNAANSKLNGLESNKVKLRTELNARFNRLTSSKLSLATHLRGIKVETMVITELGQHQWACIAVADVCGKETPNQARLNDVLEKIQAAGLKPPHGQNCWNCILMEQSFDFIVYKNSTDNTDNEKKDCFFIEVKGCAASNKTNQVELTVTQTSSVNDDCIKNMYRVVTCRYNVNAGEITIQQPLECYKIIAALQTPPAPDANPELIACDIKTFKETPPTLPNAPATTPKVKAKTVYVINL